MTQAVKETFFTHDKNFYKTLFRMLIFLALQNLISYSVNLVDNMMLGNYSQDALSGAAAVNQVFFMVDQFALSITNTFVAIAAQYWGEKRQDPMRKVFGIALRLAIIVSVVIVIICSICPELVVRIFTPSATIAAEGTAYLSIMRWTFILFIVSHLMMGALRVVGTVRISFYISIVSLAINIVGNYMLIYGNWGAPRLGIKGAAISTLIARIVEFAIVFFYIWKIEKKITYFKKDVLISDKKLKQDYTKAYIPIMISQVIWGLSVPMQTAILGHLSDDAIAANSIATTFYTFLKVIIISMSATSAVMMGTAIGKGDVKEVKAYGRTLSVIDISIGVVLGLVIIFARYPFMSLYNLSPDANQMALNILFIMGFVMMGMSYQMPVSFGIIQGSGDVGFTAKMNMISTWCIVMPLSFMAAFWWKLPVELVVIFVQSDQIFKGLPTFIHFRKYQWMKKLTRKAEEV